MIFVFGSGGGVLLAELASAACRQGFMSSSDYERQNWCRVKTLSVG